MFGLKLFRQPERSDCWPPIIRFYRYTQDQRGYYFAESGIAMQPPGIKWWHPLLWWRSIRIAREVLKLDGVTKVEFARQCLIVTKCGINSAVYTPFDKHVVEAILRGKKWPALIMEDADRYDHGWAEVYPQPPLWCRLAHSTKLG